MTNTLAVENAQLQTIRQNLQRAEPQIKMALPAGVSVSPQQVTRIVETEVRKNPDLLKTDVVSLIRAVIEVCQLGLSLDRRLGQAYLLPFKNKKKQTTEVQVVPGYRGLESLAYRSGKVSNIHPVLVHERDEYEYVEGLNARLIHTPYQGPNHGLIVAVYAIATMTNGVKEHVWMWKHEVDAIREAAPGKNSDAWQNHYSEMAKKTVVRRLCKHLPVETLQRAVLLQEQSAGGLEQELAARFQVDQVEALDVESGPVESNPKQRSEPPRLHEEPNEEAVLAHLAADLDSADVTTKKDVDRIVAYALKGLASKILQAKIRRVGASCYAKLKADRGENSNKPTPPAADVDPMAAESAKRRDDYLDRLTVSTEEDTTAIEKAAIKAEETGDMLPADVHAVTSECGRRFAELRGGE